MPEQARHALAAAGWATTDPLAASSYTPTTRRDAGGRYWRDTDAWWIDQATLLIVRAREALTHLGTGSGGRPRLRRAHGGGGTVQVTTHQLTGPVPTGQRWSRPPQTSDPAGDRTDAVRFTDTSIELLPRAVQDELGRPTGQGALRHYPPHGGYRDQVSAYRRICATELLVVCAVREGGAYPDPDSAIDAADWHITTYRPQVGTPAESVLTM
ncbi:MULTISPECIES: hypothetical protein [Pseudonocardia]|uniref:Uncharacterized protein n=1 Tax=Pseudonocardia saturnea TaxID=33909 RepID=A0ABQ0S5K1_9PSEU|nr:MULTISPECIES: hypothetical protein [Pseudonocardia]BBG05741.1 hypothetical protein Pdca_69500 [Pseudonocardia autotrophica]GEC28151.1 hypothetical protein PSA01_51800 [Pseudonocardia saturnea]